MHVREYLHSFLIITSFNFNHANDWTGDKDIKQYFEQTSEDMKAFFEKQKYRVEKALNSGYMEAVKVTDTVSNFVENQQRKISMDINSYVESVKESGRKAADSWSYLPTEEPGARMEQPDLISSVPATIVRNGYICETHTVVSQGYILNIHRIPHPKGNKNVSKKTILLQHGLFASSADWILNGPEKGLAYVLADAGYDVWMSNVRGNKYSREHACLKTSSKSYWNFSWHDIALYDIPSIIDYITTMKGDAEVTYIGHSMGTTIIFAMLTLRPEYNSILKAAFALAPVVFLSDIKSPIKSLAPIASNVAYMEMLYGSHEFLPKKSALRRISSSCDAENMESLACKNVIFYICGYNEKQFNKTLLPVFMNNLGTGTSWKTAVHFAQEVMAGGKFQQFDYGSNNQRVYDSDTPLEYDLSKITLPVILVWAENDLLSSEKDVKSLYEKLPPTTKIYKIPDPNFNHLDYLWAIEAPKLLNDKVMEYLNDIYTESSGFFTFHIGK
ncbi:lipase 3-like [Pieris brassicae]|uniref:lipase 3-like n=1 Tax=Pieris brassicae TaxID=7116 RepID=UPI001E65E7D1|nr:lipase 3-like [Pieris brassicae]